MAISPALHDDIGSRGLESTSRYRRYTARGKGRRMPEGGLRQEGQGATWMFEDAYAKHEHWLKLEYKEDALEDAIVQASSKSRRRIRRLPDREATMAQKEVAAFRPRA